MKISVVIITYNRRIKLLELLDNIDRQDRYPDEIIIWDDGSNDKTKETFEYGKSGFNNLRYYYSENKGIGFARNSATKQATGDIIVVQDSDDVFMDGAISAIENFFEKSDADVAIGNVSFLDAKFSIIKSVKYPEIKSNIEFKKRVFSSHLTPFKHIGISFRRAAVEKFGNYDPSLPIKTDVDLVLKWISNGAKFENLDYAVSGIRLHGNNISKRRILGIKVWIGLINKYENNITNRLIFIIWRLVLESVKCALETLQQIIFNFRQILRGR